LGESASTAAPAAFSRPSFRLEDQRSIRAPVRSCGTHLVRQRWKGDLRITALDLSNIQALGWNRAGVVCW